MNIYRFEVDESGLGAARLRDRASYGPCYLVGACTLSEAEGVFNHNHPNLIEKVVAVVVEHKGVLT